MGSNCFNSVYDFTWTGDFLKFHEILWGSENQFDQKENPMNINKDEIVNLTEEYGGQWGINHTRRLLYLISLINAGQKYDADVVWVAAHLHDWGAYSKWQQNEIDHALRSTQVAESFLTQKGYPKEFIEPVLEVIKFHHSGDPNRSIESILLSDADALDFLGVVGVLRDFSKNPRNLRKAYEITQQRRNKVPQMIILEKAKEIAALRIQQMDELLDYFVQDSCNFF